MVSIIESMLELKTSHSSAQSSTLPHITKTPLFVSLFVSLSLYLSVCISLIVSLYLSHCLSVSLSLCLSLQRPLSPLPGRPWG